MSLAIEKEAEVTFDFDYETLAKDVISFTMEHEHFPFVSGRLIKSSGR